MTRHGAAFAAMLGCTLLGHRRNRLAVVLAGAFIPVWIAVTHVCASARTVRFPLDAAVSQAAAQANHVGQVTNALGAVTMVSGFMMFMETFKAGEMDRRLVLAGYPRVPLLLAKVAALVVVAVLLALYTTALLVVSTPVRQPAPLALAALGAGLAYGGIGLLLGTVVRGELEGFFLVIMLGLLDTGLQNPSLNVVDVAGRGALPLYGANQSALAGAFTSAGPWDHALLPLVWSAAAGALALAVFHVRTRSYGTAVAAAPPAPPETAAPVLPPVSG
ncbi:hypothetical protein ACFSJS_08335 [Streptomyces desertarenae]|uniref:Integral membrane protein n=1 Tax=Streptomyces desertarenae TaxID=2666184 RepID=A0ABW4PJQ6_9ACTN